MKRLHGSALMVFAALAACGPLSVQPDASAGDAGASTTDAQIADSGAGDAAVLDAGPDAAVADAGVKPVDPFADVVVQFSPGAGAGFGQQNLPNVVLGPPQGGGANAGSVDVLSLGRDGFIVLEFTDLAAIDGPGPDFTVFENVFSGFRETGVVSVSDDGVNWQTFACAAEDSDAGFSGCAGLQPTFSSVDNSISATDPLVSGGDSFDLATVGLARARFVRIADSGKNRFYAPPSAGFDLDAIAVVNGQLLDGGMP